MRIAAICAAIAAAIILGCAQSEATTYDISVSGSSLYAGDGSIHGTITTDGNLGTLTNADIVSWNLTITVPSGSAVIDTSNSSLDSSPDASAALIATATSLLFPFTSTSPYGVMLAPRPA